jgi:parallel beta-helix repeat protein
MQRDLPIVMRLVSILLVLLLAAPVQAAILRTLYVDTDSLGGTCSDAYTAAENAAAAGTKPWCTLGAAGKEVIAGDRVYVRAGTYGGDSEIMTCDGTPPCSAWTTLELVKRGTATNGILYIAYPGETPIIDPQGSTPGQGTGNIYGILAGSSAVGLCAGGANQDLDCYDDTDCPGSTCDESTKDYYTTIDGFKFQNWSYFDPSPTATANSHNDSQYAFVVKKTGPSEPVPTDVTIQNCIFTNNNGGGVMHMQAVAGITFQDNLVYDNHTRGWTTAVNLYLIRGQAEGKQNIVRRNVIYDIEDDPPIWCIAKYCSGSQSFTTRCSYDLYTNTTPASPQGYGCMCGQNDHCESNTCTDRATECADGGCPCAGDTEGHGVIFDNSAALGDALIESNVIYNNEGGCITVFKSDNATIRNNTCYENGIRASGAEISMFTNNTSVHNNIIVPRAGHRGFGIYYGTPVYTIDPATNAADYNDVWASHRSDVFEWNYAGGSGTLAAYVAANTTYGYGTNSISSNPNFTNPTGSFALATDSPCIDTGDSGNMAPTDVDGATWSTNDMGAVAFFPQSKARGVTVVGVSF